MTTPDSVTTDEHVEEDFLDEEWLATSQRRSRLRSVLIITLAAAVVFFGGVMVQKEFGASGDSASTAAGGLPEGIGGGGGGFPSGMPAIGGGEETQTDGSGDATTERTSIVGKVVAIDGDVWTVEDLGGTSHEIVVTDADIVRETEVAAGDVEIDSTVDITLNSDTADGSGQDTASDVIIR